MDTETLALLAGADSEADDTPSEGEDTPAEQGQPSGEETPEQLIARGIIPEGYTRDKTTGEIRPKKTRGRPRLTAQQRPDTPINRETDEAPDGKAKGKPPKTTPRYTKGVIATGMTKLYKRAGRIIKAMDREIGIAVIEAAEDCGEAWDELARTNPRVRAFLMKLVSGGAWGSVIMAHLPIFMAIIMKDGIRKHLPFGKLIDIVATNDEDEDSDNEDGEGNPFGEMFGNMTAEDMGSMFEMAQNLMGGMARRVPGKVVRGDVIPEGDAA